MLAIRFLVIWTFLASVISGVSIDENVSQSDTTESDTISFRSAPTPSAAFQGPNRNDLGVTKEAGPSDVSCYCDDLCPAYDDCCPVLAPDFNRSAKVVQLRAEVITCRNFRLQRASESDDSASDGIFVVSRCPNNYREKYVRESCEQSVSSLEPFIRLPVNGMTSGVLYGNYYCAVCNGEPDVVFWTAEKRPRLSTSNIIDIPLELNFKVHVFVFVNPVGQKIRSCKLTPTQRCGSGQTEKEKCPERSQLSGYSYEYQQHDLIHSQNVFVCEVYTVEDGKSKQRLHDEGIWPVPEDPFMPYSVIFDLNSKSIKTNQKGNHNHSVNTIIPDCDWGQRYDPFAEVCRTIFCRPGFKLTSSGCVLVNDAIVWKPLTEHLNCSQMIRLNDSEFTMFTNDSAFVYKMGSTYIPGQYLHSPPYIYICSEFIDELRNTTANNPPLFQLDRVQSISSFVGILTSLTALLIQFLIYIVFPVLRNTPGKCVVCLVVSIFSGQLSFLFVAFTGPFCRYLAAFMHLAILSSFCWMNVLALDICKTFASKMVSRPTHPGSGSKRFVFYSVYAWFVPATIVGIGLVMDVLQLDVDFRPFYGGGVCWITSRMGLIAFFLVPVAVILVSNFVLFGVTVFCLCRSSKESERVVEKTRSKGQLIIYFKLSVIMGLTWVFGFIATLKQWAAMWYLFIVFNTLQGAFLCLAFVCTKKVLRLMKCNALSIYRSSMNSKIPTQETSC